MILKPGKINIVLISVIFLCSSFNIKKNVSLIIHHAKIYTVDDKFSIVEAMAINNGKIEATGSNFQILNNYTSNNIIDAAGKIILPGFIDAHCHFTGFATDSWKENLTGTKSFNEVLDKMKVYEQRAPMYWLYGRGWDQNDWERKEFPNKEILDSLFPDRPVFLKRIDGHAALVNQKALEISGISIGTVINGGSIETINRKATGILIDNAMGLVEKYIPEVSDSLTIEYYIKLQRLCFSVGLTGVHDCGVNEHTVELLDESQKKGLLKMKVFALLSDSMPYYDRWIKKGPYITDRLHVGGFKLYADGALGSRGACLLADYSDKKNWKGFLLSEKKHFETIGKKLSYSNLQMCTHAIGDSGNRTVLSIYEKVLKGKNDKRWRIEHAQVVDKSDIHYFGDNNIIPSVQPTHATSDMYWAESRLGENRIKNAYAYQQLLKQNNWMPLGTDFPVEDISPLKTFYAAVTRTDGNGYPKNGFQMDNALSREQAIKGMTIWAAKAAFEEKEKGSLEKTKSADFIFLDQDLMTCDKKDILSTRILATYINGEQVY